MATCYGPITFGTTIPLLVFKAMPGNNWKMIATGSLSHIDADRIVLKKVVLSGAPLRVRKKYAVVRHMFHETLDVHWFKPAELTTKYALRGHIKEPVG